MAWITSAVEPGLREELQGTRAIEHCMGGFCEESSSG